MEDQEIVKCVGRGGWALFVIFQNIEPVVTLIYSKQYIWGNKRKLCVTWCVVDF